MRKLTPLMVELLLAYGWKLAGESRFGTGFAMSTYVGLMKRGLLTAAMPLHDEDGWITRQHALTAAGLMWLHANGTTGEMRRNAARKLWVYADHAAAVEDYAELTRIEAYLAGAQVGRPVRGRKPAEPAARQEYNGSHAFRPGDGGRCSYGDCGCPPSSPNHAGWEPREWSEEDEARVIAKGAVTPRGDRVLEAADAGQCVAGDGAGGDFCTLPMTHDGNHSWAPADLAPTTTDEQRAALAADREHARRVRGYASTPAEQSCSFRGLISKRPCTKPAGHDGPHDVWSGDPSTTGDLLGRPSSAAPGAGGFDAEQFRGLTPAPGPVPAGSVTAPEHAHYGADARWTHEAGDTFKVNDGVTPELTVRARAVHGQRGRFELFFLGRYVATVEWDGGWWSAVKPVGRDAVLRLCGKPTSGGPCDRMPEHSGDCISLA